MYKVIEVGHTSWCLAINEFTISIEKVQRPCHQTFRSGTNIQTATRNIQQSCHLGYCAVQHRLVTPQRNVFIVDITDRVQKKRANGI